MLVRFAGVRDLGDPGRNRATVPVRVIHPRVAHVVLRVERYRDDLVLHQPVENLEVVSVAADESRADHFGLIDFLMVVIVLNQVEHLAERRAGDKHIPYPVVNERAGGVDFAARGVPRLDVIHENPALFEFREDLKAARLGKLFDVKETLGVRDLVLNARLRQADVSREGLQGFWLEVGGRHVRRWRGEEPGR